MSFTDRLKRLFSRPSNHRPPPATPEKNRRVMAAIDAIEAEMKAIGFWHDNPPVVQVDHYLQAPCFELWLQCVLIPNARQAARSGEYPHDSQVGQMAMREYDYHSHVPEAQRLLVLLREFDAAVTVP